MSQRKRIEKPLGTRRLLRRSVWCGTVLALAVVLCALNVLPPVKIDYEVTSAFHVSQARLTELQRRASEDAETWFESDQTIRIREIRVLDAADGPPGGQADQPLMLVELTTVWTKPHDHQQLETWVKQVSHPHTTVGADHLVRKSDFAKWQLRAAKHYRAQHEYLGPRASKQQRKSGSANSLPGAADNSITTAPGGIATDARGVTARLSDALSPTPANPPRQNFTLAAHQTTVSTRSASYQTELNAPAPARQSGARGFVLGDVRAQSSGTSVADTWMQSDETRAIMASTNLPSDGDSVGESLASRNDLASNSSFRPSGTALAAERNSVEHELLSSVEQHEKIVDRLDSELHQKSDEAAGVIEFAKSSRVQPHSHPIPLALAASVILLGICVATSAGWVQHRLHGGGVYAPQRLAKTLEQGGLPIVGTVTLNSDWEDAVGTISRLRLSASKSARRIASNMTLFCEWALWFWVYMIALRFVLDSMWRHVLWDNPLAALGRILWGLH